MVIHKSNLDKRFYPAVKASKEVFPKGIKGVIFENDLPIFIIAKDKTSYALIEYSEMAIKKITFGRNREMVKAFIRKGTNNNSNVKYKKVK
jgi:hypothetical protein